MTGLPETTRLPTTEDLKALAHATRQRILRLCRHESLTNKALAERLTLDPATALHHVRVLVRCGFLSPCEPRRGVSGALEIPYQSSGKSFLVTVDDAAPESRLESGLAGLDALRQELEEVGGDRIVQTARLGLRLRETDVEELRSRVIDLFDEFIGRESLAGIETGLFFVLHKAWGHGGDRND